MRPAVVTNAALDKAAWDALKDIDPPTEGPFKRTIGIEFSIDGSHVAVVDASKLKGHKPHIELIEYADLTIAGTKPLAQALYKIRNKISYILIDGVGSAKSLIDDLKALHYPPNGYGQATTKDVVTAAQSMKQCVQNGAFTHYNQEALNDSAYTSIQKNIGTGWVFGGSEPEPIEAASLALLAMKTDLEDKGQIT